MPYDLSLADRVRNALAVQDAVGAAEVVQAALDDLARGWRDVELAQAAVLQRESTMQANCWVAVQTELEEIHRKGLKLAAEIEATRQREASVSEQAAVAATTEASLTARLHAVAATEQAQLEREEDLRRRIEAVNVQEGVARSLHALRQEVDRAQREFLALRDAEDARQATERRRIADLWTEVQTAQQRDEERHGVLTTSFSEATEAKRAAMMILHQAKAEAETLRQAQASRTAELDSRAQALRTDHEQLVEHQRAVDATVQSVTQRAHGVSKAILDAEILSAKVQKARRMVKAIVEAGTLRPKLAEVLTDAELEEVLA